VLTPPLTHSLQRLQLLGIKVAAMNGSQNQNEREKQLQAFRESDDCHVLIVSDVAMTGLNLQFATVLIIMVRARRV
jgi:superfamily II DNA/RNA helicase